MSNTNAPTQYDPLPLTNEDDHNNFYNGPPSPDPGLSMFHTPQMDPGELGPDENAIPLGAAQPRFLGAALYNDPPSMRNSFASSNPTLYTLPGTPHSEHYASSLYALNDPHGTDYRDNPSTDIVSSTTGRMLDEKRAAYAPRTKSTRKVLIAAIIVALALIIAAVVIPLYLFVIKPSHSNNTAKATTSSNAPSPSTSVSSGGTNVRVTGGNGSVITLENGTTFTYQNNFGGYWYWDTKDPLNQSARAQSWSPALNETFNYGVDQVRGSVLC